MEDSDILDISRKSDRLIIILSSRMENIDRVNSETKDFLRENELLSESFGVCLGMREGLINAIMHGNNFDPHKTVTYSLILESAALVIIIEDQGEGFDWKAGQQIPSINLDHGRGIAIIKKYFDEFKYNDKGNRLVLIRNLTNK